MDYVRHVNSAINSHDICLRSLGIDVIKTQFSLSVHLNSNNKICCWLYLYGLLRNIEPDFRPTPKDKVWDFRFHNKDTVYSSENFFRSFSMHITYLNIEVLVLLGPKSS